MAVSPTSSRCWNVSLFSSGENSLPIRAPSQIVDFRSVLRGNRKKCAPLCEVTAARDGNLWAGSLRCWCFSREPLESSPCIWQISAQEGLDNWDTFVTSFRSNDPERTILAAGLESRNTNLSQLSQESEVPVKRGNLQTFVALLKEPITPEEGKRLHAQIIESGLEQEAPLGNLLVGMYGKSRDIDHARLVFTKMHWRDVVSWTVMITAYTQHRHDKEALRLYEEMLREGIKPDKVTYITILSACVTVEHGELIHASIVDCGFHSDVVVGTALINMYGKCGSAKAARSVFDQMLRRNVISWNTMIAAYAQQGEGKKAFQIFTKMQLEGMKPNRVTFLNIISGFSSTMDKAEGILLHACIVYSGFESDVIVQNALINMYGKLGAVEDACLVFVKMQLTDRVSWNTMISVYAQQGHSKEALQLFKEMHQRDVKPDQVTLVSVLSACAGLAALVEGKEIHTRIVRNQGNFKNGMLSNILGTALVNMYGKCGAVDDAREIFDNICHHDVVAWTAMIDVYAQQGDGKAALELFRRMQQQSMQPNSATFVSILTACASLQTTFGELVVLTEGKWIHGCICDSGFESDVVVANALINMYGKCGATIDALSVFDKLQHRTVVSWTSMISAYVQQKLSKEALQLFRNMQLEGINPDKVTFLSLLSACTDLEDLSEGKMIHVCIANDGFDSDVVIGNALVSMYGKCGALEEACTIFDKLLARDVISWNAMITYHVQQGHDKEALQFYYKMQSKGMKPNEVTFVGVLCACANMAAIIEGESIHACIKDAGLESDIVVGNALVNMYGKCGAVELACSVFAKMQQHDVHTWTALIAAYAQQGYGKEALRLFRQMLVEGLKPDKITFVSLLSAFSHAGLLEEGYVCFCSMSEDHGIMPTVEHYVCMIGLLGRAGRLDVAEELIYEISTQLDSRLWSALLGACNMHGDVERGKQAAGHMFDLDPNNSASYVLLSNLYAADGRSDDVNDLRQAMFDSQDAVLSKLRTGISPL